MPEPDGDIPLPDRAYVPGITQRHTQGSFDPLRETVHPGMEPDELQQSRAFRAGLRYLETGFFWECHEVLEAVWMAAPDGSSEKEMVQALIQLANARLKIVMKRPRAALRLHPRLGGEMQAPHRRQARRRPTAHWQRRRRLRRPRRWTAC